MRYYVLDILNTGGQKRYNMLFTKTYEDNASGKLSDKRFMMITKRHDGEQLALKKKISTLQAEINEQEPHKHSAASYGR